MNIWLSLEWLQVGKNKALFDKLFLARSFKKSRDWRYYIVINFQILIIRIILVNCKLVSHRMRKKLSYGSWRW